MVSAKIVDTIFIIVALGYLRFESESRPASRRYPGKERRDLREPLGCKQTIFC